VRWHIRDPANAVRIEPLLLSYRCGAIGTLGREIDPQRVRHEGSGLWVDTAPVRGRE
jgi:hypothetical protein